MHGHNARSLELRSQCTLEQAPLICERFCCSIEANSRFSRCDPCDPTNLTGTGVYRIAKVFENRVPFIVDVLPQDRVRFRLLL
jgi:hypothetical protein